MRGGPVLLVVALLWLLVTVVSGATNPNDLKILSEFRVGLKNPELLKWPENGDDPCGPPLWPHVFCSGDRVSQIQVQGLGLEGPLPHSFNELSKLSNLGLQRNKLSGKLPTFSGLSELEFAYLDYNEFDSIPSDFFEGLTSIRVLALDYNDLNKTHGWSIPDSLSKSVQLANLSLMSTNLAGSLPGFLGELPSLAAVKLSYNRLSGEIPISFGQSLVQILWLNNQLEGGGGMSGSIDVVGSMAMLTQLWLHGNRFAGKIPETIGGLSSLRELNLNGNDLVGLIPDSLANMELQNLVLDNNRFMGPIPKFNAVNVSYDSNCFCQVKPGLQCAPQVTALLGILDGLDYPENLAPQWSGNNPCDGPWLGLSCNSKSDVLIINLPRRNLTGSLSPLVAKLGSLLEIRLGGNNLNGTIPMNLTDLNSLRLLDLSGNNFEPPLPKFRDNVKVVIEGNPLFVSNRTISSPPPLSLGSPPPISTASPESPTRPQTSPPSPLTSSPRSSSTTVQGKPPPTSSKKLKTEVVIAGGVVAFAILILLVALFVLCCRKKRKGSVQDPSSIVVHPRDPSDPDNIIKFAVTSKSSGGWSNQARSEFSNRTENSQSIEAGNLIISVQVLRKVTKDFAPENELGRGGFGVVYKGELEDGTKIAVKRMEGGVMCNKAVDEFQAEIAVLSKVRHRHLVSLIGYSVEGNERLLVYEYMSQGALSKRLFHWESLKLEPLSWTKRLSIALDVARGVEYLHNLARETFIHRDLKSSNILLGDDFRAKVSDFGLVKLAPDGDKSVATRLAGTFGYLAPEYAVMGKITTKADVFSYGVVLMELLTGLMALDEDRSEERRYLAEWFWRIKSSKETLMGAIDPSLEVNKDTVEGILVIAELAGHCTARDPNHRPDIGHAVSVLSPLVEKWKPDSKEAESFSGIDYTLPLSQMLKDWQEAESRGLSYTSVTDSKGSIPAKPTGFADSFTSADGR